MARLIPWNRIAEFHKEVEIRSEESFFSFNIEGKANDNYSFLDYDVVLRMNVDPEIRTDQFINPNFLKRKNDFNDEYYIGGILWYTNVKKESRWVKHCNPLFYRAYGFSIEESGLVKLEPTQASWDVSPLFYKLLDKKGISVDDVETELQNLLEEAEHNSFDTNYDETVVNLLIERFPELRREFVENKPRSLRYNWVSFVAPKDYSTIHQSLISDYNKLISALNAEPEEIGGLSLIDGDTERVHLSDEISDVVPLNESQRESVENALSGEGITVISGPPGCGKSQVVLAIILNAWQNGHKVLFASNNNQAVDVVRTRLAQYEKYCPIVVRAGSRRNSEIQTTINKMLSSIGRSNTRKQLQVDSEELKSISESLSLIEEKLNTDIPQRIDELLNASYLAYAKYCDYKLQLAELGFSYNNRLEEEGITCDIEEFVSTFYPRYLEWINQKDSLETELNKLSVKAKELGNRRQDLLHKRKETSGQFFSETLDFDLLKELMSLEEWYLRFRDYVSEISDDIFVPENDVLEVWDSFDSIESWRLEADKLQKMIERFSRQYDYAAEEIKSIEEKHSASVNVLTENGLLPLNDDQFEVLNSWRSDFAAYSAIDENSGIVQSIRKKLADKNLSRQEEKLAGLFSHDLLLYILPDKEKRRIFISSVYEAWTEEYELKEKNLHYDELRYTINQEKTFISDQLNILSSIAPRLCFDSDTYSELSKKIEDYLHLSIEVEDHIKKKEKAREISECIDKMQKEGQSLLSHIMDCVNPEIKQLWKEILNFGADDLCSSINEVKGLVTNEKIAVFLKCIGSVNAISSECDYLKESISECNASEQSLISEWMNNIPSGLEKNSLTDSYNKAVSYIEEHSDNIDEILLDWDSNEREKIEQISKSIEEELRYAYENMEKAIDICPQGILSDKNQMLDQMRNGKDSFLALRKEFDQISYIKIKEQEGQYRKRKESIILADSVKERLDSLSKDDHVKAALSLLSMSYTENRDALDENAVNAYITALKALPIWITTGQSPQSLPLLPEIFDLLIVDEATQCNITSILPLIYRAKRIVVIGDTEQLTSISSISKNTELYLANKYGVESYMSLVGHCSCNLFKTMLQTASDYYGKISFLTDHYRSNPLIIGFSNQYIYKNRLILQKPMPEIDLNKVYGVFGVNVSGYAYKDRESDSWCNTEEAEAVVQLVKDIKNTPEYERFSIGIISPFRGQVNLINSLLEKAGENGTFAATVHRYQGDERDIIVFSPVVSSGMAPGSAKWVETPHNLINVAVTRAKEALFVVADFNICRRQPGILGDLVRYVDTIELLRRTSFFELQLYGLMLLQGWEIQVHKVIRDVEVDFLVEHEGNRVIVEVDGSQHERQVIADRGRDAMLSSLGFNVIRIPTRKILDTPFDAIASISTQLV